MATSNFDSLPQEVVDEILQFLHDDKTSLKACSLTCRPMVQGAQRGLFSALSVGPEAWKQPEFPSMDLFLKMMTEIPHVAPYVKSLRLSCTIKTHDQHPAKALPSFSHLTKFSFRLPWYNSNQMVESDWNFPIQNLLTLPTLRHVEFMDVPIDFFPYNTAVKHLVIRFNNVREQAPQTNIHLQTQPPGRPTILESLDIENPDPLAMGHDFVIRACQRLDISRLTRLHFSIYWVEPYIGHDIYLDQLLELCGSSLQVLKFTSSRYSMFMVIKHFNIL